MTTGSNDFYYSNKYEDDEYEYRHVHVTKASSDLAKLIPKNRLMSETEWRSLGIQQSPGWVHYMIHGPERHVLLFRRPLPNKQQNAAGKTQQAPAQVGVR
ncbi:Cyclin-dependent kinase regulatory subunit [Oesophagostomum dentatum]|uniref:Cyclin-dependent kinases regulatory subunit n=1 Tax=Oesophagostomum dentatum TaxID=61180 RepID=A0A0B1S866_OESDE|nr:Cyclin-dependent kinase regulatory subunit [Oesophagostomum dentatum]